MKIAYPFLAGHCVLCLAFILILSYLKIKRQWLVLFAFLFFAGEPAVLLIWGPDRYYGVYAASFVFFALLARFTDWFYAFLQNQEKLIRFLFWVAMILLSVGVLMLSFNAIIIRRDALTFWQYKAHQHESVESLNNLADTYVALNNNDQALFYYKKSIRLFPQSARAYRGLLRVAQKTQDWYTVIKTSQALLHIDPHEAEGYLALGEAYRYLGQKDKAVESYARLLNIYPEDERIVKKVIEAYGQAIKDNPKDEVYKEKREEVLADFEQLSKRKNYHALDYYNLGFLYEQVGGKDEAMRFYAKAIEMQPDYLEATSNLANLYQDEGNYKTAMALYGRLIHYHPRFVGAYLNMGSILNALDDHGQARQFYQKVIDLDANNADAYFNLGYLSELSGELNEAVSNYEKAVELAPKNAEAYYNLGNAYASLGQNGEAIAAYLKTVSINPQHMNAYVNLSILSFKAMDFKGAIQYLELAKNLGYNPPAAYLKTLAPYRNQHDQGSS